MQRSSDGFQIWSTSFTSNLYLRWPKLQLATVNTTEDIIKLETIVYQVIREVLILRLISNGRAIKPSTNIKEQYYFY